MPIFGLLNNLFKCVPQSNRKLCGFGWDLEQKDKNDKWEIQQKWENKSLVLCPK